MSDEPTHRPCHPGDGYYPAEGKPDYCCWCEELWPCEVVRLRNRIAELEAENAELRQEIRNEQRLNYGV